MTFLFDFLKSWLAAPATAQWARLWMQNGLILLLQTSVLLVPGVWALHVLGKRKSGARSFVGRALVASVAGVMLLFGLSHRAGNGVPALWQVSLPLTSTPSSAAPMSAAPLDLAPVASTRTFEPSASEATSTTLGAAPPSRLAARETTVESAQPVGAAQSVGATLPIPIPIARRGGIHFPDFLSLGARIWFIGALILLLWWSGCHLVLWRMRRGACEVKDADSQAILADVCANWQVSIPLLLSHRRISSPFLTGLFRPAIVLPATGPTMTSEALRAVLGHEITHLKRRDLWWSAAGRIWCALLWPQPGLWILCRQLEQINEEACDRAVLEAGCERHQLADCLLDWAQRAMPNRAQRVAGAGIGTNRSSLSRRIQAILREPLDKERRLSKRARAAIAGAMVLFAATTPFLISGRAAPNSGSFRLADLPLPDPQLKIIGNVAVGVGGADNGLLHEVKLQYLIGGKVFLSHEAHTARRGLERNSPNKWILSNALTRTYGRGGNPNGEIHPGVIFQLPTAVTRYLMAQFPTPKAPKSLEESFNDLNSHVEIGGVSKGELQGVSIRFSPDKKRLEMILARSARLQKVGSSGETRWVLRDVHRYTFNDEGLESESRFGAMTLSPASMPAAISTFLDQQSRAALQPLLAGQWTEWKQFSTMPRTQFSALENWAKGQGSGTISGRVVGDDGQPVAGVKVNLYLADEVVRRVSKAPLQRWPLVRAYPFMLTKRTRQLLGQGATTRSDGTYRFSGLANVAYDLSIPAPWRSAHFKIDFVLPPHVPLKAQQITVAAAGETRAPDLIVTRGGLVRVRVEDKDTGAPLPDIPIFGRRGRMRDADYQFYVVDSDANGQSLFRLPVGQASIALGGKGQMTLVIGGVRQLGSHVLVAQSNGVTYCLDQGAEVSLDGGAAQPFPDHTNVQIISGVTRKMTIRLTRYVAPPVPPPTPAPRLVPPPAGKATLIGRVVDEAGRPVRGVEVRAIIQQKARWKLMQGAGLAGSNSDTPDFDKKWASINSVLAQSALSRADGSFRLEGLTSAPYNLVVASRADFGLKPPADWVADAIEGVWAKEGQQIRRAAPIVLTKGALIVGRVVDKTTGLGLGGVVFGSNGPQLPSSTDDVIGVTSDKEGRFSLRVAPGVTSLYIAGPNQRASEENIVYADTRKPGNAYRIGTSRGLYAGSNDVEFDLDGGSPQFGLNLKSRTEGQIKIPIQKGQTRKLTLHLRRLVAK